MDRCNGAAIGQHLYRSTAGQQQAPLNNTFMLPNTNGATNGTTRATAALTHNLTEMSIRQIDANYMAGMQSQPNLSTLQFNNGHNYGVNGHRTNGAAVVSSRQQYEISQPTFTLQQASSRPLMKPQLCLPVKPSAVNDSRHPYAAITDAIPANGDAMRNYQRIANAPTSSISLASAFQSQPQLNVYGSGQQQKNHTVAASSGTRHHVVDRNYLNYNAAGGNASAAVAQPLLVQSLSSATAARESQPVKFTYSNPSPAAAGISSAGLAQQQQQNLQSRYGRPQIFTAHACAVVSPNYAGRGACTPLLPSSQPASNAIQRMTASTGNLASLTLSSTVYSDDGDSETYFAGVANAGGVETDADDRDSDVSNTKKYYASTWNISAIDLAPVAATQQQSRYTADNNNQYQTPAGGNVLSKVTSSHQPPPPPYSQPPNYQQQQQQQNIYANYTPPYPTHAAENPYNNVVSNNGNTHHFGATPAGQSQTFMDYADDNGFVPQQKQQQHYPKAISPSKLSHAKLQQVAEHHSSPATSRVPETVRYFSSDAFKFYMEQHIENVMKSYQERMLRARKLEQELAKSCLKQYEQDRMRQLLNEKESKYLRLKRAKMNMSHFIKLKTVGIGAFGEVALVRKIDTGQLYAMKTLRKQDVFKRNQVAHVKAERDILAEADNEWVVKLYYSFQDRECLYFVMDYVPGGDLMNLLINRGIFDEVMARFYTAQLVCAIESVHRMGFIHRDIKPDNILIDAKGHIKLTDFGLCTGFRWTHSSKYYRRTDEPPGSNSNFCDPDQCDTLYGKCVEVSPGVMQKPLDRRKHRFRERRMAHSLVGTPNYIAPEVLQRQGYTRLCDWWSVGVILYEMIIGQPPFYDKDQATTQYKVINWRKYLRIPDHAVHTVSREAQDLILRLCCDVPIRLGARGPEEIKSHSFFQGIKWDDGSLRRHKGPFVPELKTATDTSNFDSFGDDSNNNHDEDMEDVVMTAVDKAGRKNSTNAPAAAGGGGGGDAADPQHAFFEFTFRRFFEDGQQTGVPLPPTFCNNLVGNFGSNSAAANIN